MSFSTVKSDAILARLLELHPKIIDLSLDRLTRLLDALGNPEKKLPKVIHIAGTNGKGSTASMVRAGLEAAGKKVHVYSSPHLAYFHERIRLSGELISEDDLADLLVECEAANGGEAITFFEITTAAALLAFSRTPADYCILEVGLGGRLDATNVIDDPVLCIITPVSIDHQQYLGETLLEIAGEKAGIIKPNVPVVVGLQEPDALRAIERQSMRLKAPLSIAEQDWFVRLEEGRLLVEHQAGLLDLTPPKLLGSHQVQNSGMAAMAMHRLGVVEHAISDGISSASWPARMQRLTKGPLFDLVPSDAELWLDGGHNPAAGQAIAHLISEMNLKDPRPTYLICGMLNTKDPIGFMEPFKGVIDGLYGISIPNEMNTLSGSETADAAIRAGLNAVVAEDVHTALGHITYKRPRILICGSLYLAGNILRQNS